MAVGGEPAHIDADLRKDRPRTETLDARDCTQLLDGGAKGRKAGLHLPVNFSDVRIEGIDLTEMKA